MATPEIYAERGGARFGGIHPQSKICLKLQAYWRETTLRLRIFATKSIGVVFRSRVCCGPNTAPGFIDL